MRLVWPAIAIIRLLLSATHRTTVHLFTDEFVDRISLIFGPLQFLRRTPLMLSPAPEIKEAFEHAPAPALARRLGAARPRIVERAIAAELESSNR